MKHHKGIDFIMHAAHVCFSARALVAGCRIGHALSSTTATKLNVTYHIPPYYDP